MPDPAILPSGATVDAVDWLRSGTRSGLVRVRGRRSGDEPFALPDLLLDERRFASLPDPRADRDRGGWRGAYVVDAGVAVAAASWTLEWPDGARVALDRPEVPASDAGADPAPTVEAEPAGGDVVDRAVLAERRARRAEAAEQAQARIAQEALRAVEVLDLRAAELEERLGVVEAERDALRQAGAPPGALEAEVEALREELARRATAPPAHPLGDPDRRAARLREALTATVATVADLRMQLHEAQVQRRTRELEWSAEAVRLAVLEREHAAQAAELAALRDELAAARAAAEALAAREADLADARARVEALEAEVSSARGALDALAQELDAARTRAAEAEAAVDARVAEATAAAQERASAAERRAAEVEQHGSATVEDALARAAAAEEAAAIAEGRLLHALVSIDEAETARELAEARALAAEAARRAAAVAAAARRSGLAPAAVVPPPAVEAPTRGGEVAGPGSEQRRDDTASGATPSAPTVDAPPAAEAPPPPSTVEAPPAAAEAPPAAAAPPSAADESSHTPVAPAPPPATGWAPPVPTSSAPTPAPDPFAAAQARLRAGAEPPAEEAPAPPEVPTTAGAQSEPSGDAAKLVADLDAAAEHLRRRAATGDRPPLAPVLVRLAQDDPQAAAQLIAGLLPAQHLLLQEPLDYDLTIKEAGTYAVRTTGDGPTAERVPTPRGRRDAAFHVRTDARTAAAWLAGTEPATRPRRFSGPARVSGAVRKARALEATRGADLGLRRAITAGATVHPALALRALAYAVDPEWTAGHAFVAEVAVGDATGSLWVTDGGGVHAAGEPPPGEPHVRLRLTPEAYTALLAGETSAAQLDAEGDETAAAALRTWIDRVLGT